MKKVLFIDRDGTMLNEPADEQVDSFAKLEFYPRALFYLSKIAAETDYDLVMVTNQDGLGTPSHPEENFRPVHDFVIRTFANEGVVFKDVFIDKTFASDGALTRKPGTGMLTKYLGEGYDLQNSYVIGDRLNDVKLARNLGAKAIWLNNHSNLGAAEFAADESLEGTVVLETTEWKAVYEFLTANPRLAEHRRSTKETDITVRISLDGKGKANINTGLAFFDHMLEQIARHGNIDLDIEARGDLHIDEHHTIEDTAITLGEAFSKALGDKKGIERYSFSLPMDDCLAQVALDLGGRSWLVWEAEFKREKVGDVPTEMFLHFFKSFSDAAKCNLNIKAEGQNEHHKIEAIFKAFAKCLRDAVKITGDQLPSTKGVL